MKRIWKKSVLAAALFCICFLAASMDVRAEQTLDGQEVKPFLAAMTALQETAVRNSADGGAAALGSVQEGQVLNVCGQTDSGWCQVVFGTGIGYVEQQYLTLVPVAEEMLAALAQQAAFVKQQVAQQAALLEQQAAAQARLEAQQEAFQAQQEALRAQAALPQSGGNVIFVGDSRTGQMGNAVGGSAAWPGVVFVSCFGGGHEWLSGEAAKKEIDRYVTPGSVIIINYGVNDLSNHGEYVQTINRYNRDWREKGAVVYFATVGPVGENEFGKRNWSVEYFNEQLRGKLDGSIGRIDLYGYLTLTGYTTGDGLHYTPDVYARMFTYLMQSVGRM